MVAVWAQKGLEELSQLKVRKGSGEEIRLVQGKEQWLCFAGAAVKRYPTSKVRGGGRECQAATAQEQPRGAISRARPGAAARRSNPTFKEWWLHGCRRA